MSPAEYPPEDEDATPPGCVASGCLVTFVLTFWAFAAAGVWQARKWVS